MESLAILTNTLSTARCFNTEYNSEFKKAYPIGYKVEIPYPQRWKTVRGLDYQPQESEARKTKVEIGEPFGIHFDFNSMQTALETPRGREAMRKKYLEPAVKQMAEDIDLAACDFAFDNTNQIVGLLGTNPTNSDIAQTCQTLFKEGSCPDADEKDFIISPSMMEGITNGMLSQFVPSNNDRMLRQGYMGEARGLQWTQSMGGKLHTAGTWQTPSAVTVSGAGQSGTSNATQTLLVNCTSGDTFKKNDVVSIADVYSLNPGNRRSVGRLKRFRIVEDVTASASTATITIFPGMEPPSVVLNEGQYANVSAVAANAALLTLFPGTSSPNGKSGIQGLALAGDKAFAMVGVDLEVPTSIEQAGYIRDTAGTGLPMRWTKTWDPHKSRMMHRLETALGFGNLYNDYAAIRVLSLT